MPIDPRNYDLGELRDMAHRRDQDDAHRRDLSNTTDFEDLDNSSGTSRLSPTGRGAAEEARRVDRYRTLLTLESAADTDVTKPYLDGVPPTNAADMAIFEWLEFLVNRAGFRGAMKALRYYRNIGWLTKDAMYELEEYLFGFSDAESDRYGELTADDHRESLVYIAELNALT